ncbi:hypothetical protein [Methanosarcina mazei]|uniref:Transposase n=1 Tax=Methanosarcina mazei TaxID=2209 RepID=A0A0F8GQV7_METMZ|nr:hypothetical protein [Methanosarcina mazei]KKG66781.1 hypothetical protein DU67_02510 [Methanosarcina mazei]KKG77279.1 hypothetical protein DU55_19950 [Methanosarcina mazei]
MPFRKPIPKRKITETSKVKKSLKCEYIIKYWQKSVIQTFLDVLLPSFQRYVHFLSERDKKENNLEGKQFSKQENNFQRNKNKFNKRRPAGNG